MLSATPDLDAVIVATPDFMHAEHTIAALKAGKHVYCEKLMSNTVDGARSMVRAAREAGRLLQIGHQRRSNPRYIFARDKIVRGDKLLGRVTNATAQWDRAVTEDLGFPAGQGVAEAVLNRYGYANLHEFRNSCMLAYPYRLRTASATPWPAGKPRSSVTARSHCAVALVTRPSSLSPRTILSRAKM